MEPQPVVKTVDVAAKPQFVVLNTQSASQKSSNLSRVSFDVAQTITPPDNTYAASVSLKQMVFQNTFYNITTRNNKLQIASTYNDGGVTQTDTIPVEIPPNTYSMTDLVAYLNSDGVTQKFVGGYHYGLGNADPGTVIEPFYELDFARQQIGFRAPTATAGGTVGSLGVMVAAHEYLGFYLVLNDTTFQCMKTLGFVNVDHNQYVDNVFTPRELSGTRVIGFKYDNTGVGTAYTLTAGTSKTVHVAINSFNLSGPTALVVRLDSVGTGRVGVDLMRSNVISMVPVSASFGHRSVYEPANPYGAVQSRLELGEFNIRITDAATDEDVDFNGVPWSMSFLIEFFHIESHAGPVNSRLLPMFHHETQDRLHPHPGDGLPYQSDSSQKRHRKY